MKDLIDAVGEDRYRAACERAWGTAAGTGKRANPLPPDDELADVPHEIADTLWYDGDSPVADRYRVYFELYREMPAYANCLYAKHRYEDLSATERDWLWARYRGLMEDEDDRVADPVAYSLWCDWFEDHDTVEEAWAGTTTLDGAYERRLERVLDHSGPVPWALKEQLFERLVDDERWHGPIFDSICRSIFDAYGDVDLEAARRWFGRLRLPPDVPNFSEVREKLGV